MSGEEWLLKEEDVSFTVILSMTDCNQKNYPPSLWVYFSEAS